VLLHFISDLLRNPDIQKEFSKDPKMAMTRAGLSAQQQDAVQNGQLDKVVEHLRGELSSVELFAAVWIKAGVDVESVSPNLGATSSQVQLTIQGNFFALGALAALQQGTLNVPIRTVSVQNAGKRGSSLVGIVDIPSNVPLGAYAVAVANPDGHYGIKENAFTIVGS
jgi:hypothetical protein